MNTASEYLSKTESAVRKLFEGVDSYLQLLKAHRGLIFVSGTNDQIELTAQFDKWKSKNESALTRQRADHLRFFEESFAMAALCGAVLQIAAKGIELYSKNTAIPDTWHSLIRPGSKAVPFCTGREVRGVPLGLLILAARNQHTHYQDGELREPNLTVFSKLALNHGLANFDGVPDSNFNLQNEDIPSFANNITSLIGWRSYDAYLCDMRQLLV